ncbi:MAG: hypothetical protein K0R88_2261 [Solirubrobacterales bacterium]|jgi:hypothetical protein|nr:hypothetical protein [Solirubrobacterales bacterium]
MNVFSSGQHEKEIRQLEPQILPRQLRALELIAARLSDQRPAPDQAFVARLEDRIAGLPRDTDQPRDYAPRSSWLLGTAVCLAIGFGLLLVAALLVAGGS